MRKVVIFDFDGTLYNGDPWKNWNKYIENFFNQFFLNKEERQYFINKYVVPYASLDERIICGGLILEYGTAKPMIDYLQNNPYSYQSKKLKFVDNQFISALSKEYNLYIVSNTSENSVKKALEESGLNCKLFKEICFNKPDSFPMSKGRLYKTIMKQEKVSPQEIIVVGDNFYSDLLPAKELGLNTLLVHSIHDLYQLNKKEDELVK